MQDAQPKAQERTLESIFRDILAVNDRQRDKWSDDHALKNILDHRPPGFGDRLTRFAALS